MQRTLVWMLILGLILLTAGCGGNTEYPVTVTVSAGSTGDFYYTEEQVFACGSSIFVRPGDGAGEMLVMLKPMNESFNTGFVAETMTPDSPAELDLQKGEWYRVGVFLENQGAEDMTVTLLVRGVKVQTE